MHPLPLDPWTWAVVRAVTLLMSACTASHAVGGGGASWVGDLTPSTGTGTGTGPAAEEVWVLRGQAHVADRSTNTRIRADVPLTLTSMSNHTDS
jgi:hypothetical protein